MAQFETAAATVPSSDDWYKEGEMHAQSSKFHFSFAHRLNSQNLSPTQPIQFRWVSQ